MEQLTGIQLPVPGVAVPTVICPCAGSDRTRIARAASVRDGWDMIPSAWGGQRSQSLERDTCSTAIGIRAASVQPSTNGSPLIRGICGADPSAVRATGRVANVVD